jgi:hypothetical protein
MPTFQLALHSALDVGVPGVQPNCIHMELTTRWISLGLVAVTASLWVGCGQQEQPTPTSDAPKPSATTSTSSAAAPSRPLAETAQQVVDKAGEQAQALIEQTKAFLSEQNYAAAAGGLEKLAGMSLTPEQTELVKELKVEAAKVSDVVGNKLGEVRKLVDEKKYQEASAQLAEMVNVQLTPEQQQLVDKLKAEIQKGLSGQAVESGKKALGGLLQGN